MSVKRLAPTVVGLGLGALSLAEAVSGGFWLPGAIALSLFAAAALWLWMPRARVIAANVLSIGGLFALGEAYWAWGDRPHEPDLDPPLSEWKRTRESRLSEIYHYPAAPWAMDDVLGASHRPNSVTRERRYVAGRLVADATYTTGAHGFRVTKRAAPDADAVLLFGCSMTWGSNIDDTESYPWQLGEMLGASAQVLNFGIAGSGPNAMLAAVQAGYEREQLPKGKVVGAYYLAWLERSIGHLARVLGRVPWAATAPRYELASAGPPYVDANGRFPLTFDQALTRHSFLTAALGRELGARRIDPNYDADDVRLLAAIVRETDRLLRARHHTELTVLVLKHPSSAALEARFAQELERHGVRVSWVSLPPSAYLRGDIHPNPFGAHLLAEAVLGDLHRRRAVTSATPPEQTPPR